MGTHLRVLNESYPMNTNMTGFRRFSKNLCACAVEESSFSIGRVNLRVNSDSITCYSHAFENNSGIK